MKEIERYNLIKRNKELKDSKEYKDKIKNGISIKFQVQQILNQQIKRNKRKTKSKNNI